MWRWIRSLDQEMDVIAELQAMYLCAHTISGIKLSIHVCMAVLKPGLQMKMK